MALLPVHLLNTIDQVSYTDVVVNTIIAGVVITPGMVIETFNDSGVLKWRPVSSATDAPSFAVALNDSANNRGIDDDWAVGDLVIAKYFPPGTMFLGIVPDSQTIPFAARLQNDGTGKFIIASSNTAASGLARWKSERNLGTTSGDTRTLVRVTN